MSEWKKVKLKDCCIKIGSGSTPKGGSMVYVNSGTSLIRSQNVYNLSFDYNGLTHITEDAANKLKGVTVFNEDILLNITGDSVARTCIVPKEVLPARVNQHVAIIRTDRKKMNWRFLNYYLASPKMQAHMLSLAVGKGASRNALTKQMIENFEVPYPPLSTQHRIANILSRYDSLIENYQKQIKLLEEAAQRLYKEWFIDLRFPGHENTNIIDGVPEGWEKKKLIDLVDVQYGYAFDGHLFNSKEEGTPIVRIRNIPDGYTNDYTTEEASESYIINDGDILVGMDGIFHINTWSGGKAFLVQRACSFRPKDDSMKGFILQAIYEPIKFFENTVVGATVAHLGKKHIDSIELLVSKNVSLYKPFEKMFNERQTLKSQLRLLTEARDRLLPKLMSGEITV